MSIVQAIILGIVQGLTEFLPVSSTAHLTIVGKYLGIISAENPEQWTATIAVIQLGTLAAILIYFALEIRDISLAFLRENISLKPLKQQSYLSKMGWFVIIGTLPIVAVGLGLKKFIEGHLTKDMTVIGVSLIMLAIILYIADRVARFNRDMNTLAFKDALIIGSAQAFALIPGASRSGVTITAALFTGLTRETAARFSFLLSIPAVLASGLLELKEALPFLDQQQTFALATAAMTAGIVGYMTIALLLRYLKNHTVLLFVIYRILLGVALLIFAR